MLAIGLMSGTSLDGIDAALIETDGEGQVTPIAFRGEAYSDAAREQLAAATALALTFDRPRASVVFCFVCGDGKPIAIHLSSPQKFWVNFATCTGHPELIDDPRFSTRPNRRGSPGLGTARATEAADGRVPHPATPRLAAR